MTNPLDELETQAKNRQRRGRQPGGSRNPRPRPTEDELRAREEEQRRRRQEREQAETTGQADILPEPPVSEPQPKRSRPKSMPFYPNPEDEQLLWSVAEVAAARHERIPATSVLRFALRRLSDQMTAGEIVRALSGPVQTEGKMGRPRR